MDHRTCRSAVSGVYPVMRKWHRGVGIREATRPTRSLFMYPGYRRVVVLRREAGDVFAYCIRSSNLITGVIRKQARHNSHVIG